MTMPTTAARRAVAATALLITGLLLALGLLLAGVIGATLLNAAPAGASVNAPSVPGRTTGGTTGGASAIAGPAASTGWVRLAHLSPNAPAVDVYLYNFGNPAARLVLHHVSYGTVSPYQQVPAGEYTVSMRAAGAKGSAPFPLPWLALMAGGGVLTTACALRYRITHRYHPAHHTPHRAHTKRA